jgi:hypothetical protein
VDAAVPSTKSTKSGHDTNATLVVLFAVPATHPVSAEPNDERVRKWIIHPHVLKMVLKQDNQVHRSSTLELSQSFQANQDYSFYLVTLESQSLSVVRKTLGALKDSQTLTPEVLLDSQLHSKGLSKLEINSIQPVATLGKGESMIIYSNESKP